VRLALGYAGANGEKMTRKELLGIRETEEGRRIDIDFWRVARLTLALTNAFFICYFFARLFQWI
jgi:hypothetical protein